MGKMGNGESIRKKLMSGAGLVDPADMGGSIVKPIQVLVPSAEAYVPLPLPKNHPYGGTGPITRVLGESGSVTVGETPPYPKIDLIGMPLRGPGIIETLNNTPATGPAIEVNINWNSEQKAKLDYEILQVGTSLYNPVTKVTTTIRVPTAMFPNGQLVALSKLK